MSAPTKRRKVLSQTRISELIWDNESDEAGASSYSSSEDEGGFVDEPGVSHLQPNSPTSIGQISSSSSSGSASDEEEAVRSGPGRQASLEAANNDATRLHHRLAEMSAEASRLYQLLYHNQQCLEGLQQEKEASISRLEAAQIAAEEEHKRHVSEMKAKQRLLNELNDIIEEVKRTVATKEEELLLKEQHLDATNKQIEELQSHLTFMEQKYKDQQSKNAELTRTLAKLEDRMVKRERIIEEKGNEIEKLQKVIQHLEVDLTNYKMLCKVQEKNLMEKEAEMTATQQQLNELQRMRDVIYEISGGKKKM